MKGRVRTDSTELQHWTGPVLQELPVGVDAGAEVGEPPGMAAARIERESTK